MCLNYKTKYIYKNIEVNKSIIYKEIVQTGCNVISITIKGFLSRNVTTVLEAKYWLSSRTNGTTLLIFELFF